MHVAVRAQVISLSVDTDVLLLFCFGLLVAIPPKLLEQRSTLLLTCSHHCIGRVPRGQWACLDSDTLVVIDRSACLVEMIGFGLPHLHYAYDSATLATACMEQVRLRFSVSCGRPRRCARASAANSSRARVRAPSALSAFHLANHAPT